MTTIDLIFRSRSRKIIKKKVEVDQLFDLERRNFSNSSLTIASRSSTGRNIFLGLSFFLNLLNHFLSNLIIHFLSKTNVCEVKGVKSNFPKTL